MPAANLLGPALALTSALSWSLANVAVQSSSRRFGSWGALIWAQLIGGAIATCAALLIEGLPPLSVAALPFVAGASTAALFAYIGLFESLRLGQVAVVTPIISAWSVVSVAWAVGLGAPLSAMAALGVGLVVLGNVVLARTGSSGSAAEGGSPRAAIAWAVASALGFGCMVPLVDRLGATTGRLWTIPLIWAPELVVAIPWLIVTKRLQARPKSARDWLVAGRCAIFEVSGFIALTLALAQAPVTVVSPLSSLSTAGSVFLGLALLREKLRPITLAAAALACCGVVLVNL